MFNFRKSFPDSTNGKPQTTPVWQVGENRTTENCKLTLRNPPSFSDCRILNKEAIQGLQWA